jgi:hypothetical protein
MGRTEDPVVNMYYCNVLRVNFRICEGESACTANHAILFSSRNYVLLIEMIGDICISAPVP